ncbi:MAG TPA: PEGA domain-containing protein [Kofleriaceae bacterium]|nr:PEGA domain-containing protein [Kofleriaceae bacterium]
MATPDMHLGLDESAREGLLRFGTRFDSEDDLAQAFSQLIDGDILFIATRSAFTVGLRRQFSLELRDGRAVLRGEGQVIESPSRLSGPGSPIGLRFRMLRLTSDSMAFHTRLLGYKFQREDNEDTVVTGMDGALRSALLEGLAGDGSILPANPLSDLSDDALDDLIECVIHEDVVSHRAPSDELYTPGSAAMVPPPRDEPPPSTELVRLPSAPMMRHSSVVTHSSPSIGSGSRSRDFLQRPVSVTGPFPFRETGPYPYQETGSYPFQEMGPYSFHETGPFPFAHESGAFPFHETGPHPTYMPAHTPAPVPAPAPPPQAQRAPILVSIGAAGQALTALLASGLGFFGGYLVFHQSDRAPTQVAAAPAPTVAAPAAPAVAPPVAPLQPAPAPTAAAPVAPAPTASAPIAAAPAPTAAELAPTPAAPTPAPTPAAAPQPSTAHADCVLSITTRPAAARVLIDGHRVADGPLADVSVPCQELTVTIQHPGFRPYTRQLVARAGKPIKIDADLARIESAAPLRQLSIESKPPGAIITIDGSVVGRAPFRGKVSGKSVFVTATQHGYKVWSKHVRVTDRVTSISVSLEPIGGDRGTTSAPSGSP